MDVTKGDNMLLLSTNPIKVQKIASGWAAFGDGWAVHAPTKELVLKEYEERVKFYKELLERPDVIKLQEEINDSEK
jgi:hypothetical protein